MNKEKNTQNKPTHTTRKILTVLACALAIACLLICFKPLKNEDVYVLKAREVHNVKSTLRATKELMGQEITAKEKCGSECPICHRVRWRVKMKLGI